MCWVPLVVPLVRLTTPSMVESKKTLGNLPAEEEEVIGLLTPLIPFKPPFITPPPPLTAVPFIAPPFIARGPSLNPPRLLTSRAPADPCRVVRRVCSAEKSVKVRTLAAVGVAGRLCGWSLVPKGISGSGLEVGGGPGEGLSGVCGWLGPG